MDPNEITSIPSAALSDSYFKPSDVDKYFKPPRKYNAGEGMLLL